MILEVVSPSSMNCWTIVNKFDGVIVGREYTKAKAEATAKMLNASEMARIKAEYNLDDVQNAR